MSAFYLPRPDGCFTSTPATTSPWDVSMQHGGPPTALLARAIETHQPRPDTAIGRISVDFLGPIPQGVMEIDVEILRPGKRIELVEARLTVEGRVTVVARAWRSQVVAGSALRRRYSFRTAPRWLMTVSSAAHCGVDGLAPASAHD